MILGEHGITLRVNLNYVISAADTFQIELIPPSGEANKKTVTATLGTGDVTTTLGVFTANEYVTYDTLAADIDEAGIWQIRALITWNSPAKKLVSADQQFTVTDNAAA